MEQYGTESELPDPSLWAIHMHLGLLNDDEFWFDNALFETANERSSGFKLLSAISASFTSPRSADSTMVDDGRRSTQSRRWSLKVIVLNVLQCCHACGRKERTEDMDMESKQADRLKEKPKKKALMSRKGNFPPMLDAASSTSATRGDKPLQKDTERISKPAALDKKEEETRSRKGKRPQLGGKSSSKCMPVGKLYAKLSRKIFPGFHGQSSRR